MRPRERRSQPPELRWPARRSAEVPLLQEAAGPEPQGGSSNARRWGAAQRLLQHLRVTASAETLSLFSNPPAGHGPHCHACAYGGGRALLGGWLGRPIVTDDRSFSAFPVSSIMSRVVTPGIGSIPCRVFIRASTTSFVTILVSKSLELGRMRAMHLDVALVCRDSHRGGAKRAGLRRGVLPCDHRAVPTPTNRYVIQSSHCLWVYFGRV